MISFKRLKDIREDNDYSQREMALILGVKRSAYSLWELGINIIPLRYLVTFADYFDYSLDYLLGLSNRKGRGNMIKAYIEISLSNLYKYSEVFNISLDELCGKKKGSNVLT